MAVAVVCRGGFEVSAVRLCSRRKEADLGLAARVQCILLKTSTRPGNCMASKFPILFSRLLLTSTPPVHTHTHAHTHQPEGEKLIYAK